MASRTIAPARQFKPSTHAAMRAAIYARVSTTNGQDPTVQTRELEEYCTRRGWQVVGTYIDIGISGRIAQAVGRKLFELSKFHQVICITHLPQIASIAEHHYFVDKIEKGGRTETKIRKLSANEKAEAIAKLLAGEEVSEAHLKSAQELLENAN